jgi:hypothetical protein
MGNVLVMSEDNIAALGGIGGRFQSITDGGTATVGFGVQPSSVGPTVGSALPGGESMSLSYPNQTV